MSDTNIETEESDYARQEAKSKEIKDQLESPTQKEKERDRKLQAEEYEQIVRKHLGIIPKNDEDEDDEDDYEEQKKKENIKKKEEAERKAVSCALDPLAIKKLLDLRTSQREQKGESQAKTEEKKRNADAKVLGITLHDDEFAVLECIKIFNKHLECIVVKNKRKYDREYIMAATNLINAKRSFHTYTTIPTPVPILIQAPARISKVVEPDQLPAPVPILKTVTTTTTTTVVETLPANKK